MMRKWTTVTFFSVIVLFIAGPLFAVSTSVWEQTSQSDFNRGKLKSCSTSSRGEVTLSPKVETVGNISQLFVWTLVSDSKNNIYAGTGDQGIIYKITPDGKSSVLYKSSEINCHALAVDKAGNVYAGTAPRGIIYRITPAGEVTIFYDASDPYIWALAFDSKGNLLAATGNNGKLYRISPRGEATIIYKARQSHILTMIVDKDVIYAGTEPEGVIYKIEPQDDPKVQAKVSVLYDSPENEVHCLALDAHGNLYAGTAGGAAAARPPSQTPPPSSSSLGVTAMITRMTTPNFNALKAVQSSSFSGGSRSRTTRSTSSSMLGEPKGVNSIYKITPAGEVDKILAISKSFIFSMAAGDDGYLYLGTGNSGRIYKVAIPQNPGNPSSKPKASESETGSARVVQTLLDRSESQITSIGFFKSAQGKETVSRMFFGTGNVGRLCRLSPGFVGEGAFESSIHDTSFRSKWGRISWTQDLPEGTSVSFSTRTGNTTRPDSTWSDWSKEYTDSTGEKIESPRARFIQYRLSLKTSSPSATPRIADVSIAYLTENQPPKIGQIKVSGSSRSTTKVRSSSSTFSKSTSSIRSSSSSSGRKGSPSHSTKKTISWQAGDPNGDALKYDLYYKGLDEKNWKKLKKDITTTSHSWDTESVPDGRYQVKVVAYDSPSNPPSKVLSDEKVNDPFLIDNTRPTATVSSSSISEDKRCVVEGTAKDLASNIMKIQFSVDADEWVSIFPKDEIFDSKEEELSFSTEPLEKGEHTIVIRVQDADGNIGTGAKAKVVVEVE